MASVVAEFQEEAQTSNLAPPNPVDAPSAGGSRCRRLSLLDPYWKPVSAHPHDTRLQRALPTARAQREPGDKINILASPPSSLFATSRIRFVRCASLSVRRVDHVDAPLRFIAPRGP